MALSSFCRRSLLIGGVCAPFAARAAAGDLSVKVRLEGETFVFTMDTAENLGAFTSPAGFTQECYRATNDRLPLTVYFRPDRGQERSEIVFELGRLWGGSASPLGNYEAEIQRSGDTIARVNVPRHHWFSRWRWATRERPVRADVKYLISRGLVPPYARASDAFARFQNTPSVQKYRVMDLAGVEPKMGSTGERSDIGLVTELQAAFLCSGSKEALAGLRAQAEAAGTLPWHIRDERTAAPVDLDRYETMSWYGDPNVGKPYVALPNSGIQIDAAHQPALAYVPYLLTGDPYHLEDLQFAAVYNRGALPPAYRLSVPQPRAFAWSLRTLSQAAKVTPRDTPRWLLPASYFERGLARTRRWFQTSFVESKNPLHQVFHATDNPDNARDEPPEAPGGTWISPWQHEFLVAVLGCTVGLGFDDWRQSYLWALRGTIDRTSGQSGWRRSRPAPYRLIVKSEKGGPLVKSWEEAWRLTSTRAGWTERDDTLADGDPTYAIYTRGALAIAVHHGIQEANAPLTWITEQLRQKNARVPYKWLIA